MQEQDSSLLEEFVVENSQSLQAFEQDLLALEETGASPDIINRMFRAIHSMKGSSGYLGLTTILNVSHLGETLLDQVRKNERDLTPDLVDVLLKAVDALRAMVDAPDLGASYNTTAVLSLLREAVNPAGGSAPEAASAPQAHNAAADAPTDPRETQLLDRLRILAGTDHVEASVQQELRQGKFPYWVDLPEESRAERVRELSEVGRVLAHEPPHGTVLLFTVLDPLMIGEALQLPRGSFAPIEKETLQNTLREQPAAPAKQATPAPTAPAAPAAKAAPTASAKPAKPKPAATPARANKPSDTEEVPAKDTRKTDDGAMIKIHARFLDELLRLTGNMVMSRNQLLNRYSFSDDAAFATLSQAITEVHRSVVQTRMKPVDSLFDRFRRVVRDLSRQLGKDVELRTEGGEMELDRTILEAFVDPLTHMIRNSLDHGIESAAERQASAKPHMATVTLKAFQESGEIIISVGDDGRGIDVPRVKAKALERGLLTPAQATELPDNKAVMLIFEPGFSTAEKISEVSGRGVGMDVVRTNIEAIGGVVDCQTEPGRGTTIQARLPLTKAMVASSLISALVVRVGAHRLCIPQSAVNELIRVSSRDRSSKVRVLQGQEVFQHRELVLPIVPLAAALGVAPSDMKTPPAAPGPGWSSKQPAQTLIVLQHRNNLFGMIVDEIIGIEEAVVREMPKLVADVSVFSGHTVLGDGHVVMLIDIGGVVERMNMKFSPKTTRTEQKLPALSVGKRADRQAMIIFNYDDTEFFAVPLELVSSIEKIKAGDIHRVGQRHYYPFKSNTIPLLFLDKHLPVTPIKRDLSHYNLILPARVKFPIGLITNADITVHDISEKFDSRITHDKGVLGTFMHGGRLVMLLDLYALFENDDPDHFDTSGRDTCTPARILIAEDSLFYRKLNVTYLTGPGRKLNVVTDGREALLELRQHPDAYDLVVTDIEMPNMDGFELIKAVRGDPLLRELPVIALTALQDEASRQRGMKMGFNEYVVKVDKDSLTRCVERYARSIQAGVKPGPSPLPDGRFPEARPRLGVGSG